MKIISLYKIISFRCSGDLDSIELERLYFSLSFGTHYDKQAQRLTHSTVGIHIESPVFSHGRLYVAYIRVVYGKFSSSTAIEEEHAQERELTRGYHVNFTLSLGIK